jgi:hypothetical protein
MPSFSPAERRAAVGDDRAKPIGLEQRNLGASREIFKLGEIFWRREIHQR